MTFIVAGKFNRELDLQLREISSQLKKSRISDNYLFRHPHLPLVQCETLRTGDFAASLRSYRPQTFPIGVVLENVGQSQNVAPSTYLQVAESDVLRDLQRHIYSEASQFGAGLSDTSAPGAWTPQVALIKRGLASQAEDLLAKLLSIKPRLSGWFEKLALLDTTTKIETDLRLGNH